MKLKTKLTRILLLLALMLVPLGSVQAQTTSDNGGVFLFGQNYTLREGETLNGSIAVFGGNVLIEKDATVNGSIAVFGGNINVTEGVTVNGSVAAFGSNMSIGGTVNGDLVIFGGNVMLTKDSLVDGDIATFGGQVTEEPGSQVTGDITNNTPPDIDVPNAPTAPEAPNPPVIDIESTNPLADLGWNIFLAFVVAGIGMLLTLFLQPQLDCAGLAVRRQPFVAGGYGLLAYIVVPVLLFIMFFTIILIPVVAVVVFLIIPAAWVFGMVALGQEVGDRFARAINQTWSPVLATGFGTLLLMLILGFIELIPCIGWIPSFLATAIGFGTVIMTWFGTRNPPGYLPSSASVDEAPPAS